MEEARSRPDWCDETVNILGSRESAPPECETPEPAPEPAVNLGPCPPRPLTLPPPTNTSVATDREALMALFNATSGEIWDLEGQWGGQKPLGEWSGVTTNDAGRVVALSPGRSENRVSYVQLTGAIPPELGNLVNLKELSLNGEKWTGAIPPELGYLVNLESLGISGVSMSGAIPPELGNLVNLKGLGLDLNQLTGEIPPELDKLSSRRSRRGTTLTRGGNQLSGCISSYLYHELVPDRNEVSSLTVCDASHPEDEATLIAIYNAAGAPDSSYWQGWLGRDPIGQWQGVSTDREGRVVSLSVQGGGAGNRAIPPELGNLVNLVNLRYLDLSGWTAGEIPPELGNLANLEYLYLAGNQLTGEIPPELGNLANLEYLHLGENQLTGCVPADLLAKLGGAGTDLPSC